MKNIEENKPEDPQQPEAPGALAEELERELTKIRSAVKPVAGRRIQASRQKIKTEKNHLTGKPKL